MVLLLWRISFQCWRRGFSPAWRDFSPASLVKKHAGSISTLKNLVIPDSIRNPGPQMPMKPLILNQARDEGIVYICSVESSIGRKLRKCKLG